MTDYKGRIREVYCTTYVFAYLYLGDVTAYLNGMYQEDQSFGLSSSYYGERGTNDTNTVCVFAYYVFTYNVLSLTLTLTLSHAHKPSVHTGTFTDLHTHTQMFVYVFGQSVVSVCLCLVLYVMYNAHETVRILI